ncbi:MAG: hypothetical protein IKF11_01385 [Methanobrevibacter sp.]|nr:hypothetical protein [Methanobrevibacter sp.]
MFTLLIPRKIKNGRGESLTAYHCQELYCISRYETKKGKLQYQTFFKDINKYAEKANFDKLERDSNGNIKLPKYTTTKGWPAKYEWDKNYNTYEEFMNGTAQADFQKLYVKNMRATGLTLIDIKTNILNAIHTISKLPTSKLLEGKTTYQLAKLTETLKMINELIQEDILFGQDDTAPEDDVYVETVDLESDEFMEDELEYLIRMVDKS